MSGRQHLWEGRGEEGRAREGEENQAEGKIELQCSHKEGLNHLSREFLPGNDLQSHLSWSWSRRWGECLDAPMEGSKALERRQLSLAKTVPLQQ